LLLAVLFIWPAQDGIRKKERIATEELAEMPPTLRMVLIKERWPADRIGARQSALKAEVKQILAEDQDLWKALITATLQQTLEAEMDEALAAKKSERTDSRLGFRSERFDITVGAPTP
jgi:hypothetical protein